MKRDIHTLDEIGIILSRPSELPFDDIERAHRLLHVAAKCAANDRHLRGLPLLKGDERPVCAHCGKVDPWGLEFYDYDTETYPHSRYRLAVRWVCEVDDEDHPLAGYQVPAGDSLNHDRRFAESWHSHLASKTWFDPSFRIDLEVAQAAIDLRREGMRARRVRIRIPSGRSPRNITPLIRALVMERDTFRCRRCGVGPTDAQLVVDHIIPVSKGGTADGENLQTLCATCNAGKGARDPHTHDRNVPGAP